jgi:hypothetical protein
MVFDGDPDVAIAQYQELLKQPQTPTLTVTEDPAPVT